MLCRIQQLQRGAWTRQVTVRFRLLLAHQRITVGTFSLELLNMRWFFVFVALGPEMASAGFQPGVDAYVGALGDCFSRG